jgi:YidC/Oxa1 family membrane protein insertase
MNIGAIFTILLTQPITNLLVGCYQLFAFLHIPFALGFSIILLTFIIRLVLYPFTASQIKTSKKMQDMAPHISNLKAKHKSDKKKQQEEMMKLYSEYGVNPAAGCLPVIIQIPIIWSLYHVLSTVVNANSVAKLKEINHLMYFDGLKLTKLWEVTFFWNSSFSISSTTHGSYASYNFSTSHNWSITAYFLKNDGTGSCTNRKTR